MLLKQVVNNWLGWIEAPHFKLYDSYMHPGGVTITGHLFKGLATPDERLRRRWVHNAKEMLKRYVVSGFANQQVHLILYANGEVVAEKEIQTDQKGFFNYDFALDGFVEEVKMIFEDQVSGELYERSKEVLDYRGIKSILISDIDDTILVSYATKTRKKLGLLLTKNPKQRKAFKGMAEAYQQAEQQGFGIFYISSSEWNLYDFIRDFHAFNQFPKGVLKLSDLVSWDQLSQSGNGDHSHKFDKIDLIMKKFPGQSVSLIGDSGQEDARLYDQICTRYPKRVDAVRIRDIRKSKRAVVSKYIDNMRSLGVDARFFTTYPDIL